MSEDFILKIIFIFIKLFRMRPEVLELSAPNPKLVYPQLDAPTADPLPEVSIDGIEILEHFEKVWKITTRLQRYEN